LAHPAIYSVSMEVRSQK